MISAKLVISLGKIGRVCVEKEVIKRRWVKFKCVFARGKQTEGFEGPVS